MSKAQKKIIGLRRWLVIGSAGLLTALILALVGLLYSEAGLRWVVAQAESRSPGELRIGSAEGQLVGPLRLQDIRYQDEDMRLELDSLDAEWRLGMLLFGTARIDRLDLAGLRIFLPEPEKDTDSEPPALPESISIPIRVNINAMDLAGLLVDMGEETVFELDALHFNGLAQGHQLRLNQLTATSPLLDLDAEGELEMRDAWPLRLHANWRLHLPDLPELAGATRIVGDQQRLAIEQALDQPFRVSANGEVREPLTALQADLDIRFRDLDPTLLLAEAPPSRLAGQLRFYGGLEQFRLRGRVDATDTPWGDLGLDGDISLPADVEWLNVHRLNVDHQQHAMQLHASGELKELLSEDPMVDLQLSWKQLAWPLDIPEYVSAGGEASLRGRLSDYRLELSTRLGWLGHHPTLAGPISAEIHTRLTGSQEQASIESLHLLVDEGPELQFSGQVDWSEEGEFIDGDVRLANFDPALLLPDWPGRINGEGHVRFSWRDDDLSGTLQLASMDGELIGMPLQGRGGLGYESDRVRFDGLFLSLGESHLRADGQLTPSGRSAIRFDLDLNDLREFPLDMAGSLKADGEIAGSLEQLDIRLIASGESLRHESLSIASFDLELALTDSGEGDSRIKLLAETIQYEEQTIRRLQLEGDGQRDAHRLGLMVEQELLHLGVSIAGQLSAENDWDGELIDLRLSNEAAGEWQLRAPASLAAGPSGGHLETTCLETASHDGELCFSGQADERGHWRADIDGRQFPLAMLLDREETGVEIEGEIELSAQAQDDGEGVFADGQLTFSPGMIRQRVDGEPMTLMAIDGGQADFQWTPAEARGELALDLSDGGHFRAWAELPAGIDGRLEGRLDANIPQLGLLPVLVAEVGRAEGQLLLSVDIDGRLNDPLFSGDIRLVDAELSLPDIGITAEAVNAHVSGGMEALHLSASAESGGGTLTFDADLDRLSGSWQGSANLSGERFLALNIPDARVRITPDLDLAISKGQRMDISGELHVPWARITPSDLRTAVQVSADEVLVGEMLDATHRETDWALYSQVRTSLGDEVHFDGYGLTGRIVGALAIRDEPGALTRATGELEVRDGHYEAWRQRLEVERGRLFFSDSPVSDPALDIRAVRRPRNVLVGVNIRGTLRQPELTLFSEPPMQQSEQLSYLLTGHPLTEGGEGDMDLIREASLALQVAGGAAVGRSLGRRLGVDSVTIEADGATEETSVVFGEYISPRLFISYGIGLFEGINVFRIRYEISSRWFLEAQTGPRSGADFIYSLERG